MKLICENKILHVITDLLGPFGMVWLLHRHTTVEDDVVYGRQFRAPGHSGHVTQKTSFRFMETFLYSIPSKDT